ncbi:kinase-like protein [Phlebopus sp. FC_14]|nr:kinase-like protein [Phlebopus sp. FC_14]
MRTPRPSSSQSSQRPVNPPIQLPSPLAIPSTLPTSSPSPSPSPLPRSSLYSPKLAPHLPLPPSASLRPRLPKSAASTRPGTGRRPSFPSSVVEDILAPGDLIGQGISLMGHPIQSTHPPDNALANEFQVIRRLGTGSYAVVYLVREVLSRSPPSEDGHCGVLDIGDSPPSNSYTTYGRDFALKCLSKANLDQDALAAQMSEVTIHQSLRPHPNIVTLHRTFETPAFLLLVLEYVPGEDLFYFLEQARDHYEPTPVSADDASSPSRTPPTPSLLASLHPTQLLSQTRLRLIARMFAQMCDAVASCHDQGVFHRDIKPENFIVTDGFVNGERRVVVKLTDFGLSTTEEDCADMDCGSAPYMSFECRNNVAPTYRPAAADVWSLGIVLINMLYHYNPWTDTAEGVCSSFTLFRQYGANFFMQRFTGMTAPVADFLANRVFFVPSSPSSLSQTAVATPLTAREFGAWIKDLPALLTEPTPASKPGGHKRVLSTSSITLGHSLSSCPPSRRPSSRAGGRTPVIHSRSLSRAPSFGPAFEKTGLETVPDLDMSLVEEHEGETCGRVQADVIEEMVATEEVDADVSVDVENDLEETRSRSTKKRGRRGARKSKSAAAGANDETLEVLAVASQTLAREISMASRSSSKARALSSSGVTPVIDISRAPSTSSSVARGVLGDVHLNMTEASTSPTPPAAVPAAAVAKKTSKWKLSFGKGSSSPVEESAPGTASNVSSLIMGLSPSTAPAQPPAPSHHSGHAHHSPYTRNPLTPQRSPADEAPTWTRGRQPQPYNPSTWGPSYGHSPASAFGHSPAASVERKGPRGLSPQSTQSGALASSASSIVSSSAKGNWRSSMSTTSSASTSTSAFTRYSNSSVRSISTTATSVSSGSWRAQGKAPGQNGGAKTYGNGGEQQAIPKNVKIMSGVPWELYELPRQLHPNPVGDIFGQPPQRKPRTRKPKDSKLDTISERPGVPQKSPVHQRRDAATSTTDLDGMREGSEAGSDGAPKKVQKGQINALAKMLSALRR